MKAIAWVIHLRDADVAAHSSEVVQLALAVGERFGLDDDSTAELRFAALLHDLGKVGIPDSILHKDGPLDESEWTVMRRHPAMGASMLEHVDGLERVAEIVLAEHERWDGHGYPHGLRGSEIPLASRIIFACDAYHAMTTDRPYSKAFTPLAAAVELRDGMGTQFDPDVVISLLEILADRDRSLLPVGQYA